MKSKLDFLRIDGGRLGAINFNNMFSVNDNNIVKINLSVDKKNLTISEFKYKKLLEEQLYWLNRNNEKVFGRAEKLYNAYVSGKLDKKIVCRCCNFKLLEEKCDIYNRYE